jgi:multidrug resistance efflux pump/CheY-like chemotaxis protein
VLRILHVPSFSADGSFDRLVGTVLASVGKGIAVEAVDDASAIIERLDRGSFDAIVVAHTGRQTDAVASLDVALAFATHVPVVVLTDEDDEQLTERVLADGAVDCLTACNLAPPQLELAVRRAVTRHAAWHNRAAAPQHTTNVPTTPSAAKPDASRQPQLTASPGSLHTPIHPDLLRRRPKSGLVIGLVLLVAVAMGVHHVWTAFFRYHAYGIIVGRAVDVTAPWDGQIKYVHVEEGESVRQGDLLVTTENLVLCRELDAMDHELAVSNAELNSKVSELKWNASYFQDVNARTSTTFYETWGQLLHEREMVTKLRAAFDRAQALLPENGITKDDFDKIKYELRGRIHKVDKLTHAVNELRKQVESAEHKSEMGTDQLSPLYAKITAIEAKREQLRAQIAEGQLRSPVNGTVLRRNGFAGERCDAKTPIVTVVEETSARVLVYFSQNSQRMPKVGDVLTLQMPPYDHAVTCVVERIGNSFELPPKQIARHYLANEKLLPVHMKPTGGLQEKDLRLGAVVMLPNRYSEVVSTSP